ncbi:MAG: transcription elongation factor GreA [Bacteroidetes bacterium]|jgi:transcription elongation factor GreA|nr:MAG: transcription elongation factor GreA [Bacteroidota bacterium]
MANVVFTEEGLQKLKNELYQLKTQERKKIAQQIAEAREKGDLSENAEYTAALEAQAHLEARIAELEQTLQNARVVDQSQVSTDKVSLFTMVKLKNHTTKAVVEYRIVTESEANVSQGKISVTSPIGKCLIGKCVGEIVEVKVPAGIMKLEILEISL